MATGITKHERHSQDSISALDVCNDPFPLPHGDQEVTLEYENKAPHDTIIENKNVGFIQVNISKERSLELLPDDSFVLADNYFVLNRILHDSIKVNLFYLDPPYGTGFDFHSRNLEHSYKDKMGKITYIEFMRRRLVLMRECMADDGSIYVHIGHHMLAHLKVIMDEIFGSKNFRNLITRRKCSSKNFTRNQYPNLNDYVLFYSKSKRYKWTQPGIKPDKMWIEREYPKIDEIGRRYKLVPIHAPGARNGETGKPWRGVLPPPGKHWQYAPSKLEEFDQNGDIHWSRNGNPRRKVYWSPDKKSPLTDYWDRYRDAYHQSIKETGYPTEKNLEMLKVIVQASSDPGDLVVDPFCGSGTTLHAARDLGRRYIGVDASFAAAKAAISRMRRGLEPMGDYVNGRGHSLRTLPLIQDPHFESPISFIVDERIAQTYRDEIGQISAI